MTPHNNASKGDYADVVLLPGDPLRAKWIAETFFDNPIQVNNVRNCLGYTGTYKGVRVSTQAGGMGMASNGIYIHELYNNYDVKCIIRVGSAGGISKKIKVGDIVAATTASTDSNITNGLVNRYQISPSVTYSWLERFMKHCPDAHVGSIVSNDYFYNPNPNWWKGLQQQGTVAVEMETHILYALASQFNKEALSVCTISDHLDDEVDDKRMSSTEREQGFTRMIEAVLKTIC
jgi:purine-nucleoside phosphorylase